jgi:uncharacterized membrane protein
VQSFFSVNIYDFIPFSFVCISFNSMSAFVVGLCTLITVGIILFGVSTFFLFPNGIVGALSTDVGPPTVFLATGFLTDCGLLFEDVHPAGNAHPENTSTIPE